MKLPNKPRTTSYANTVGEIIAGRNFVSFSPEDKVPDIIKHMQVFEMGAGCVTDASGRLMGLITERDIVRKLFSRMHEPGERESSYKHAENMSAWDIMIANPLTVDLDTTICDALDNLCEYGFRYVPVLNSSNQPVGIIDVRELYEHTRQKSTHVMREKDAYLTYFMGSESYGVGTRM